MYFIIFVLEGGIIDKHYSFQNCTFNICVFHDNIKIVCEQPEILKAQLIQAFTKVM